MEQELKVISDFYDFMLYLIQRVETFPRHHRYSLGIAIENRLQTILALLLRAKYIQDKLPQLREANIELEVLRFQMRLASDLKAMPAKSYGHSTGLLLEIGSQVGGWIRSKTGRA
ncbi:MAG: diversity-generating retroelement protein Avd [Phycisphaerae bacterium]|nr:diversity-generating retroelement protein Avd [Phycisphaerae bacterium]